MTDTDSYCRCCKNRRGRDAKPPRKLVALDQNIVSTPGADGEPIFRNPATPVFVCPNCDGDVLRMSSDWALKGEASDT